MKKVFGNVFADMMGHLYEKITENPKVGDIVYKPISEHRADIKLGDIVVKFNSPWAIGWFDGYGGSWPRFWGVYKPAEAERENGYPIGKSFAYRTDRLEEAIKCFEAVSEIQVRRIADAAIAQNYTIVVEDGFNPVCHYYFCDTQQNVIEYAAKTYAIDGNETTVIRESDNAVVAFWELKL